jgi:photosystem II stability/assembly factor-like uncharacterized protein
MCSEALRSDAALADVRFVDPQHGWAVGDRGTIWVTEDRGDHWNLQASGVGCRLESVSFVDAQTGWAAGGAWCPYLDAGSGVVLTTGDGGQHWQTVPKVPLPKLRSIGFFNQHRGWAVGCSSPLFPSGVFVTDGGGRGWNGLPGPRPLDWRAAAFLYPGQGAVAGRGGEAAVVRHHALAGAVLPSLGLRAPRRMKLIPPGYGWLVGDGGLVLVTTDAGGNWRPPPSDLLPDGGADEFDFAAVEVRGPRCWVAGSPGTLVFYSPDAGRSWTAAPTGQTIPLEALCFADDQNGWAVGWLGTILATRDGGRTWRVQRRAGARAAILGLLSEPKYLPFEWLARLAADEGYLAAMEFVCRRDVELAAGGLHAAERAHDAVVACGGCGARTAWRFPLRQAGVDLPADEILAAWDEAHRGRGRRQFEAHLVRQIRLWRPDLVLTHDPQARSGDPMADFLARAVVQAVERAADPAVFPEQIGLAGLAPWQVKKVYAALRPGAAGTINLQGSQLAGRWGRSLEDLAWGPRSLVDDHFRPAPASLGFSLLVDRSAEDPVRKDFLAGIAQPPGGEARRLLIDPERETVQTIGQIAARRRNVQAILDRAARDPQGAVRLLAGAGPLVEGLDADSSARFLYQLAEGYRQAGEWSLAADAWGLLVQRHAEHPLTRPALLWLIHYWTSAELAWRAEISQPPGGAQPAGAGWAPPAKAAKHGDMAGGDGSPTPAQMQRRTTRQAHRLERARELVSRLEQTLPDLFADPRVGFAWAAAQRGAGRTHEAERFYLTQRRAMTRDAWWACAEGESWLAEIKGSGVFNRAADGADPGPPAAPKTGPPAPFHSKPVALCAAAPTPPRLDGRLDDPAWQAAKPVELTSAWRDDALWPATVKLAYDERFLYLAIRARQAPGVQYPPAAGPRSRDADLSARDRVEIYLDTDRDYATYYRLVIDSRGWAADSCCGDATWNPTWFIASAAEDGWWTAEAAIPLDQLTGRPPVARSAWAIGVQRIVPGVGFQSWNWPAAAEVLPEGFGYLVFQ